ncbi:Hypothetical predicted protein [Olea europaea subsp. europaea]|uniref:Uncharacterized protein n=1 Tax=Olea europaea subsp. europaea TaxID=158383 RepID=A0A8S0U901_OLEEU|nr:Hypothetical predicted protein [Olea europaea subsp. europaea]
MQAPSTSYARPTTTVGSSLTIDDVQDMLLDQRILIEMRLRTVKLEIMQHVSDEFKKLKDFISTVVPASCSKCTARAANVDPEPRQSDYGGFADYVGHHPLPDDPDKDMGIDRQEEDGMCITDEHMEPCPDEQDMQLPTGTESLQSTRVIYEQIDIAHIQPYSDDQPVPVPTRTEEVQTEGGHQPSPDDRDEEQDMLPTGTEHLQYTTDIKPCPDNDPIPVPVGTDEVQGIPSFIEI